jgi:uncharacterized membrane protein
MGVSTFDLVYQIFRWIHFVAGIAWIGHLYYFNFCQTPFMNETDASTKSAVLRGLAPKALWWFRWGAAFTFLSGLIMLKLAAIQGGGWGVFATSYGVWIIIGSVLGSLMAANVWFIIWPAQKAIIASANSVAAGGQADPTAAARGARAAIASRTNVLFSLPMLFLMGACRHLPMVLPEVPNFMLVTLVVGAVIVAIQLNAMFGKMGPMKSIVGVIHLGVALTAVFYGLVVFLI